MVNLNSMLNHTIQIVSVVMAIGIGLVIVFKIIIALFKKEKNRKI